MVLFLCNHVALQKLFDKSLLDEFFGGNVPRVIFGISSHSFKRFTKRYYQLKDIPDCYDAGELPLSAVKNDRETCVVFFNLSLQQLA